MNAGEQHKEPSYKIFHFKGKWEMPSLCGLRIMEKETGTRVVFTELYEDNPGSSVTGMIEPLATDIVKKYGITPDKAEFIVHNPERSSKYEFFAESYYRAIMLWDGEKYSGLKWERVEGI